MESPNPKPFFLICYLVYVNISSKTHNLNTFTLSHLRSNGDIVLLICYAWSNLHVLPGTREEEVQAQRALRKTVFMISAGYSGRLNREEQVWRRWELSPPTHWFRGALCPQGLKAVTNQVLAQAKRSTVEPEERPYFVTDMEKLLESGWLDGGC